MLKEAIHFVRRKINADGGAELAARTYIRALHGLFKSVNVICETWEGSIPSGINVLGSRNGITRTGRMKHFQQTIAGAVSKSRGALVHSHEYTPHADVIRLGDGLHSSWLLNGGFSYFEKKVDPFHRMMVALESEALRSKRLRAIITNSEFMRNEICQAYGVDFSKVTVIRNVVQDCYIEHTPTLSRDSRRLVFIGSGWHRKGLDRALEALIYLDASWHLDVIGGDRDERKYRAIAAKMGIQGRVSFLGRQNVTPLTYTNYACVLHPARYEPFPNIAMECLSQGVPIVGTNACGTSDWGHEEGVYTSPPEPHALAKAVLVASLADSRQRENFRRSVTAYDRQYLTNELQRLYSEISN